MGEGAENDRETGMREREREREREKKQMTLIRATIPRLAIYGV